MNPSQKGRTAFANRLGFLCSAALLSLLAALPVWARVSGVISGTVVDSSGAAVANVLVTATNRGTSQAREEKTGVNGEYKFSLLPPGDYRVKFMATGFKTANIKSVTLDGAETVSLNQVLAPEPAVCHP